MKRILLGGAGVIFFVVLVMLVAVRLFSTSETATPGQAADVFSDALVLSENIATNNPGKTIQSCYAWYLYLHSHSVTLTSEQVSSRPELDNCFTEEFQTQWISEEQLATDPLVLTYDPRDLADAQIVADLLYYEEGIVHSSVTLGSGSDAPSIIVHLINRDGTWKIMGVSDPSDPWWD